MDREAPESLPRRPLVILLLLAAALCALVAVSISVSNHPLVASADPPPPTDSPYNPVTDLFPVYGPDGAYNPADDGLAKGSTNGLGPLDPQPTPTCSDVHCIQHVVIIMQENQSFDRMFGVFNNAQGTPVDGLPTNAQGTPVAAGCVPDVRPWAPARTCGQSYPAPLTPPSGQPANNVVDNPHQMKYAQTDVAGVAAYPGGPIVNMTGFLASAWSWCQAATNDGYDQINPACASPVPVGALTPTPTLVPFDVMQYLSAQNVPNYWLYAQEYVLQDHMSEPAASYSLPSHLYMVSNWSATCPISGTPIASPTVSGLANGGSCYNELGAPQAINGRLLGTPQPYPNYAWTDITYLLNNHQVDASGNTVAHGTPAPVDWRYYIANGTTNFCGTPTPTAIAGELGGAICHPTPEPVTGTVEYWDPLYFFTTVHTDGTVGPNTPTPQPGTDGQIGNIKYHVDFANDAANGTLPPVSWIVPSQQESDHPPHSLDTGQTYVTAVISDVLHGDAYQAAHTAIFLAWDDWGGYYDHEPLPTVGPASAFDQNGYGIRVPGLVISPYAKHCVIDSQPMSFDAYDKFIEDDFLGGERLDPTTDGRPDPRATWQPLPRETSMPTATPGAESDLKYDFNFNRTVFPTPVDPFPNPTPGHIYPTPNAAWCQS